MTSMLAASAAVPYPHFTGGKDEETRRARFEATYSQEFRRVNSFPWRVVFHPIAAGVATTARLSLKWTLLGMTNSRMTIDD
jgi:hypothetical protein